MNIYILDYIETTTYKNYSPNNSDIICARFPTLIKKIKKAGFKPHNYENIKLLESDNIEILVRTFLNNWYKLDGKDITNIDGLSYGIILEGSFYNVVPMIFKYAYVFQQLLKRYRPGNIFYDFSRGSWEERTIVAVAQTLGVDHSNLRNNNDNNKSNKLCITKKINSNRKRLFKKHIHHVLNILSHALFLRNSPTIIGFFNERSFEFIKTYHGDFSKYKIAFTEYPSLRLLFPQYIFTSTYLFPQERSKSKYLTIVNNIIKQYNKEYYEHFTEKAIGTIAGINLSDILLPVIIDRLMNITELLICKETYLTAIHNSNVKIIITPNDCMPKNRLLVLLGKQNKIPSIVVQHGMLGWRFDRNHLLGDYSAVWGNAIKNILLREGLEKNRVFKTGYLPRIKQKESISTDKINILIITTNAPLGSPRGNHAYPHDFFHLILETLQFVDKSKYNIKVKIHPSENMLEYKMWSRKNKYIKIYQNFDSIKLVQWADVVIASGSTLIFDSLICGKIVLYYHPSREPIHWSSISEIFTFHEKDTLYLLLSQIIFGKLERNKGKISYKDFVGSPREVQEFPQPLISYPL